MGNVCECVCRQTDDDAEDALLASLGLEEDRRPRGPPPPYQPQAPVYAEEHHLQLVQRITLIQALPCARYKARKVKDQEKGPEKSLKGERRECPICMTDYVTGDPIRLLPCMHYYHLRCIDDWLMRSFTCPTCLERVDIGLRATIHSTHHGHHSRSHRRHRAGSSSSTSTLSSSDDSLGSSEHLLGQVVMERASSNTSPSHSERHCSTPPPSPGSVPPVYTSPSPSPHVVTYEDTGSVDSSPVPHRHTAN